VSLCRKYLEKRIYPFPVKPVLGKNRFPSHPFLYRFWPWAEIGNISLSYGYFFILGLLLYI